MSAKIASCIVSYRIAHDATPGHHRRSRHRDTQPVVKLLGKRWWIPITARPEGPKLEPKGPRAEVGFPTADQGLSGIQGTLFGFCGIFK